MHTGRRRLLRPEDQAFYICSYNEDSKEGFYGESNSHRRHELTSSSSKYSRLRWRRSHRLLKIIPTQASEVKAPTMSSKCLYIYTCRAFLDTVPVPMRRMMHCYIG